MEEIIKENQDLKLEIVDKNTAIVELAQFYEVIIIKFMSKLNLQFVYCRY